MRYGMAYPPNNRMWYERPIGTGFALSLSGGTMEGPVYLWREPRYPTEAASKAYVDFAVGNTGGPWLSLHGGQMHGPLLLRQDPVGLSEAATKNYVDRSIRLALHNFAGDYATKEYVDERFKTLSDAQAGLATKDYVDQLYNRLKNYIDQQIANIIITGGGVNEAPLDGRFYVRQGSTSSWLPLASVIDSGIYNSTRMLNRDSGSY